MTTVSPLKVHCTIFGLIDGFLSVCNYIIRGVLAVQ